MSLGDLLKLDPANPDARKLKEKIEAYLCGRQHHRNEVGSASSLARPTWAAPRARAGSNDDQTLHHVKITKAFMMQTTPVTQEQWKAVMGTTIAQQRDKASPLFRSGRRGGTAPQYAHFVDGGGAILPEVGSAR